MRFNPDFRDLFAAFNDAEVRYLVVGAHAVSFHARPRYTKDLDVWVDPSPENAPRTWKALAAFGAPLDAVEVSDFSDEKVVYHMGIEPNRIDILMGLPGLTFPDAWPGRSESTYGGVPVWIVSRDDLITNKRTVGRSQDLQDVEALERSAREEDEDPTPGHAGNSSRQAAPPATLGHGALRAAKRLPGLPGKVSKGPFGAKRRTATPPSGGGASNI